MKDSNLKITKVMSILKPIVAVAVLLSVVTTLLFYWTIVIDANIQTSLRDFIIIAGPMVIFGCPILLIFTVLIIFNDIVMFKLKSTDKVRLKSNLKFGAVLLVLNLLVLTSFYFAPNVSYWRSDPKPDYCELNSSYEDRFMPCPSS